MISDRRIVTRFPRDVEHRMAGSTARWAHLAGCRPRAGRRWVWLLVVGLGLCRPSYGQVEAAVGQPFGVARVTIPFPPQDVGLASAPSVYTIEAAGHRVCYPAFNRGVIQRLLGAGAPPPARLTVSFLFRGSSPFDVTIRTPSPQVIRISPRTATARIVSRLQRRWWLDYQAMFRDQPGSRDYPPIVGTYLQAMLSRRMGRTTGPPQRPAASGADSPGAASLTLIAGVEKRRLEMLRDVTAGTDLDTERATYAVPAAPRFVAPQLPVATDAVTVEPISLHVPEECFYVRFGSFSNYLWLDDLLRAFGGELSDLVTARGFRPNLSQRLQQQLAVKQSAMAKILGPQVISDMALIGRDTFLREGAAVGILFEARLPVLSIDLNRQRAEALERERDRGATEEMIDIAGHQVAFLSTPDNRLRSFYAIDGNYHLITTARAMVERFYAAGKGERPLGTRPAFRQARQAVAADRGDTLFAFLSAPFFQGLLSPQYQVELGRRLRASAELEALKLARWAAHAEGQSDKTVDALIGTGLLPEGFGTRGDGSGPILVGSQLYDSLRGAAGYFLPVCDVPLRGVTTREAQQYAAQASVFSQQWKQLDPIYLAIRRQPVANQPRLEQLTIDATISPLEETKYGGWLSVLGDPVTFAIRQPEHHLITAQASLKGGLLLPRIPPHTMFLGVVDHVPLTRPDPTSILKLLQLVRTTPGYLGAWPKPGFLDILPFGLGGQPDASGFSQLLFGIHRWQGNGFAIVSADPQILAEAAQTVRVEPTDRPAQIRLHIGDLSRARFARWLDGVAYERCRQTSVGNVYVVNLLTQQLGVPQANGLEVAEDLLLAKLACPLGGRYELADIRGTPTWRSTAWPTGAHYRLPDEYHATVLTWLRGLEAELQRDASGLRLQATVLMQPPGKRTPATAAPDEAAPRASLPPPPAADSPRGTGPGGGS